MKHGERLEWATTAKSIPDEAVSFHFAG